MIRAMTTADVPAVRRLQSRLADADPALVEFAVDGPFRGLVAVDGDDGAVGYAVVFPARPANLVELVVAPEHRRQGYGRALVERAMATAEATAIEVSTPVENDTARRFYASLGFEIDERIEGFYSDGTDALRLRRRE